MQSQQQAGHRRRRGNALIRDLRGFSVLGSGADSHHGGRSAGRGGGGNVLA